MPITANGIIPINAEDVAGIPPIALSIPDFEGEAILRLFANSTQTEIGCYSAVLTNGNSFSHPESVGSVLGVFTVIAIVASFATAIYGEAVPTMRLHYAHSLSVGVVMAVFQHIFFTGALSVNWPSVLSAWFSNFAWSAGMIYSESMQSSINNLVGTNLGNTSMVGAAETDTSQSQVGGGFDISRIYRRAAMAANHPVKRDIAAEVYGRDYSFPLRTDVMQRHVERSLQKRAIASAEDGYHWYGNPIGGGLPLPGNYSGFAGTLGQEGIRASNAFMTGFLWFLILLVILVAAVIAFKWTLEAMARFEVIKQERLGFFRQHWTTYTAAVALRTCYLAWFMMMFLTIFQFTYSSSGGVKGIAAIVFVIFMILIPGAAAYAIYYKKQIVDKHHEMERKKVLGFIPWASVKKSSATQPLETQESDGKSGAKPFWKRINTAHSLDADGSPRENIHDNDDYTMKFGWLTARFRRTRWWFFAAWLVYELLRAIFYAGASGYALAQVFGLLIIEFLALGFIVWTRPFEGRRLNLLVVYCLGFSKVTSIGLSAAFDTQFNLERITTTVIGVVIIVIQGILTIITMIAIVVGAISSYMSVSRNHENFRPRKWHGLREKYFDHLDRVANDLPKEAKPPKQSRKERREQAEAEAHAQAERDAAAAGFEMKGMKRLGKIEDDDNPNASGISLDDRPQSGAYDAIAGAASRGYATPSRRSRAPSVQSMSQTNLPYGARPHRASWSTRDFSPIGPDADRGTFTLIDMSRDIEDDEPVPAPVAAASTTKLGRKRSTSNTNPPLRTTASNTSLQVGGDVSSRDMIGVVPAPPTTRPRSGTHGSRRNSRGFTPTSTYGQGESQRWSDFVDETQPGSQRGSRHPLTPAMELDEWTPKNSREL